MSRDRKWALVLGTVSVLALGGLILRFVIGPPVSVLAMTDLARSDGEATATVQFAGDTLLGDQSQRSLDKYGYDWPFDHVLQLLTADYLIANAEGPFTTRTKVADPTNDYSYNALPIAAEALAKAGVQALGLSNNHAMDRGPGGLADTLSAAETNGLATVGAGATPAAAGAPLIIKTDAGSVGVVAMGEDFGSLARVSDTRPGMTVMRADRIRAAYFQAKAAGADWVVAYVHWGDNYAPINAQQRYWAKIFAQNGYDMVVGTGPHVIQPIEYIGGMPVVYSIGNFVFGTPGRWADYHTKGYGLLLTAEFGDGAPALTLQCLSTDNAIVHYQPRPCSAPTARKVLTGLSPDIVVKGEIGTLTAPAVTPTG